MQSKCPGCVRQWRKRWSQMQMGRRTGIYLMMLLMRMQFCLRLWLWVEARQLWVEARQLRKGKIEIYWMLSLLLALIQRCLMPSLSCPNQTQQQEVRQLPEGKIQIYWMLSPQLAALAQKKSLMPQLSCLNQTQQEQQVQSLPESMARSMRVEVSAKNQLRAALSWKAMLQAYCSHRQLCSFLLAGWMLRWASSWQTLHLFWKLGALDSNWPAQFGQPVGKLRLKRRKCWYRFYWWDYDLTRPGGQGDGETPCIYIQNYKTSIPPPAHPPSPPIHYSPLYNNFIMAQNFDSDKRVNDIEKKMLGGALMKSEEEKKREIFEYDNEEFMVPMPDPAVSPAQKGHAASAGPQIKKSMVLNKTEVERSLNDIYSYYTRVYLQPTKEYSQFDAIRPPKLDIKGFLLFAKNFRILKNIFSLDRMILIFKKHADFGKYLSFDNFYFMVNSMSHEQEVKTFFNLDSMLMNLDIETIEELEKQEFYNYLQLKDPEIYRKNFTELFGSFNIKDKPRSSPLKYNYRKFSLPELRKKALLEPKQKKKGEKDLFILKHDKEMHQNVFDEAKSIVVSWDSLRAKSVNNLGKPSDIVQKKYLKIDPEEDPYLQEVRPASKPSPKNAHTRRERQRDSGNAEQHYGNKIQKKIKEIEQTEKVKNQQILDRIEKKLKLPSSRRLQV